MQAAAVPLCQSKAIRHRRVWHVSPEGFRELRHACFLNRKACAAFLGVGLRTIQYWEAGRSRVPFAVVRLLRVLRLGDLGALDAGWAGWTLNRLGLHDPAGRSYDLTGMRAWWITCEQARLWRQDYARRRRGVGAEPLRGRFIDQASNAAVLPDATASALHPPRLDDRLSGTVPDRAAAGANAPQPFPPDVGAEAGDARRPGSAAGTAPAGALAPGERGCGGSRRLAPQGAGLVSSLKQVTRESARPLSYKASGEVPRVC